MCAQSSRALPPLAFGANEGAEDQRQAQANCKMTPKHVFLHALKLVVQVANKSLSLFTIADCAFLSAQARVLNRERTPEAKTLTKLKKTQVKPPIAGFLVPLRIV